jgi:hypothetical protein
MKTDIHDLPTRFISCMLCKERLLAKEMNVKVNKCLVYVGFLATDAV